MPPKGRVVITKQNQTTISKNVGPKTSPKVPMIASVQSLAGTSGGMLGIATRNSAKKPTKTNSNQKGLISAIPLQELKISLERIDLSSQSLFSQQQQTHSQKPSVGRPPLRRGRQPNNAASLSASFTDYTPPPPLPSTSSVSSEVKTQIVVVPPIPKKISNMTTMCKPITHTKAVTCRPQTRSIECQTDESLERKIFIPIPVPLYIPQPMYMYSLPTPIPVPFPLPIPVPVFIPTTRNSANGIMKEIKKIQDKMPADPYEAELLMMAEMVAGDKKKEESDSSDDEPNDTVDYSSEPIETANASFGEDMLTIALKMATEYEEPAVDLESAMPSNTITPAPNMPSDETPIQTLPHHLLMLQEQRYMQTYNYIRVI